MRHVDDRTIHAWLDGQVGDPVEAAWIEQHLRTCEACAARLAEERATFEQANAILSSDAPPVVMPPFKAIAERAAANAARTERHIGDSGARRSWILQLGWAASILLAAGIGWLARDLTDTSETIALREAAQVRRDVALPAPIEPAPAPLPASTPEASAARETAPKGRLQGYEPSRRGAAERESDLSDLERTAPTVAPPANTRGEVAGDAAAPAAIAVPPAAPLPSAPLTRAEAITPQAGAAPVAGPSQPPAAPQFVGSSREVPVRGGTVGAVVEWRTLPRTEAAAQTGMALYGIDGLEPVQTMVSQDGRIVRTRYRLASGELVELDQRRSGPEAPPPLALQETIQLLAPQGRSGGVAARVAAPPPRVLSVARGDVQLTLRTSSETPDLSILSTRLRVD